MNFIKTLLAPRPISMDVGILMLRILAGGSMLTHGLAKFQKMLYGDFGFGDPLGIGPEASLIMVIFAEFFCSILLMVGLATRFALIPLIITMAVAYFIVHAPDDFNTKETAFLYLGIYLTLFLTGAGKFSADNSLYKAKSSMKMKQA